MNIEELPTLPLPIDALPAEIHRFAKPDAPAAARMMAARGAVPITGPLQVVLLSQLAHADDESVRETARSTLSSLPEQLLHDALKADLHPSILDFLAEHFAGRAELLEPLISNPALADATALRIARFGPSSIIERLALNQARLLRAPALIEALYKNKNLKMSTADRLIEFAARNELDLVGIPAYRAHVEALKGQLIPEPLDDEELPGDAIFREAIEADSEESHITEEREDGEEEIIERFVPLAFKIREMSLAEKIRLALVGDAAARALLVRDPNRLVAQAAISSPSMREDEAIAIAGSREISEDILRYIANKREWLRGYEIKKMLVFNPKTPVGISLRFLPHLRANDLKTLARSRGIPGPLKSAARQRVEDQAKGRKR